MSSVEAGQLWVSADHKVTTHYVIAVDAMNATLIEVEVVGKGKAAKIRRVGKDPTKVSVLTMLETWMPIGRPAPPTEDEPSWHKKLLEEPEF